MSVFEYETKVRPAALLKYDARQARGTALFSRYRVVDVDGDYTEPGFLPQGAIVPLLVAHQWTEVPVGKGKIRSEADAAYFDFTLADTGRGRELAEWLRFDMADGQPKSEWSYGFKILEGGSSQEMIDGKSVRVLHARPDGSPGALVKEVSYVLAGAGIGTQLIDMKAMQEYRWEQRYRELTQVLAAQRLEERLALQAQYERWRALSAKIDRTLGR
jgi:hypothetical protein